MRAILLGILLTPLFATAQEPSSRALIIVIDGLRPDYVTPERMPNLYALGERGVFGDNHHSVVPTVTRVNSPSIATGSYPRTHGIMGNSMYVPEVLRGRALNTGDRAALLQMEEAYGGELLTAPTLGEILHAQGKVLFAASSGSSGSGYLLNPRAPSGALVHSEFVVPDTLRPLVERILGPFPDPTTKGIERARRALDAVLMLGIDHFDADAIIAWFTEPDGTAHATGVGSPQTLEILRDVDREMGRLLDGLQQRGELETTNIFVTSDHGFSQLIGGRPSYGSLLIDRGLKASTTSDDVVISGEAIHVGDGGPERIAAIVRVLQETVGVGAIFTSGEPGSAQGSVPGTLSLAMANWDHARAADVLVFSDWLPDENRHGFPGLVTASGIAATHGSTSPFDVRATFLAAGPDIKRGIRTGVPTGNADLAPTVLRLLGLPVPPRMDGRVLRELLTDGPDPSDLEVRTREHVAETSWETGSYRVMVQRSEVDGTSYLDFTRVTRN